MAETSLGTVLAVVLDLHPRAWDALASSLSLDEALRAVTLLCNAHLANHADNELAVIAALPAASRYILQGSASTLSGLGTTDDPRFGMPRALSDVAQRLSSGCAELMGQPCDIERPPDLPGALTLATCYCNRFRRNPADREAPGKTRKLASASRILCLSVSPAHSAHYVALMNVAFATQKQSIPVDACTLSAPHGHLEQLCELSRGIYLCLDQPQGLIQALLELFSQDPATRTTLVQPELHDVNYQSTCFCHGQALDQGFVCSVCLSIFCSKIAICPSCRTPFSRRKRKVKKTATAAASTRSSEAATPIPLAET